VAAALQDKEEGGDRSTTLQEGLWLLHCRKRRRWRPLHNSAGRTVAAALQEKEGGDRSTTLQEGLWLLHCRKEKKVETARPLGYCLLSCPSGVAVGRPGKVTMTVASCLERYLTRPQVAGLPSSRQEG
jgi:hypothetical protein